MKYCSKCSSIINEEHKFCTNCGTKVVESDEETITNDSENNSNKKEITQNSDQIRGFLIFIGILLVLGLVRTLSLFNEYYKNEYYESMSILFKNNNELFTLLNISYYLTLICLFLLLLLNISFFTKSNITKKLAISYFTLLIITDVYGIFIFLDNKEVMSKLSFEIIKIGFQIITALFFIVYFSISKRVKETFIIKRNLELHILISVILPLILFFYYSNKLDEIKNKIPSIDSSISATNKNSSLESNYSSKKDDIVSNNTNSKNESLKNIQELKKKELMNFVIRYIDNANKGYIYDLEKMYANEIKSYSNIAYSKEKVFKDKKNYLDKWNIIQMKLIDFESIEIIDNYNGYYIKYKINFLVYNTKKMNGIKGTAINTFVLNNDMKIIEEQQDILDRDKFTNPNELLKGFFSEKISSFLDKNITGKIITSNYPIYEGEIPHSLLIVKYKDKFLNYYESGFFINSFEQISENKIYISLANNTTERNYSYDLEKNQAIFIGDGTIEIIKYGENKGLFKVTGKKTYFYDKDGNSNGARWYDALLNDEGKIVEFISKANSKECVPAKTLVSDKDIAYLRQSLNEIICVDY